MEVDDEAGSGTGTAGGTVDAGLRAVAARLSGKAALLDGEDVVTYGELDAAADAGAAGLRELGLAPGDRVALLATNSSDAVTALYAIWRAGLVAVPLNLSAPPPELGHVLSDAGVRAVVADPAGLSALDHVAGDGIPTGQVLVTSARVPGGRRSWRTLVATAAVSHTTMTPQPADGALALLQYTSGTTGPPRGAMLPHAALLANHDQMAATRLGIYEHDVVLCVLPLFHIYALNVALAFPLSRGASVLLVDRFDPRQTLADVVRHRASVLIGAPPLYAAWTALEGAGDADLASVRYGVSGAAPLSADLLAAFTARFGIPLWEGYGLTETAPLLTTVAMSGEPRPATVGRPVPGVQLRLVDSVSREVAEGDLGEVEVRGPNLFVGYWQDSDATRAALDDGWLRTGDIGYLDGGDLHLVDRTTDLVLVSGFNVYPREVEEALARHPAVAEAAAIGVPHPRTGQAVKAYVVLAEGTVATPEELAEHCREWLARFKCPEEVVVVEGLPHLPTGKLRRRSLRELDGPGAGAAGPVATSQHRRT